MRLAVFGLGYIGSVLAACLAENGHSVVGVDVNPKKVAQINDGASPVDEPGVERRISDGVDEGRIRATTDASEAVVASELSFLTVGTPLDDTGRLSTRNLYNVMDSAVPGLSETDEHTFVVRSTVPPRTTRNLRTYVTDEFDNGTDIDFLVNPEFLREGTALTDFYSPPYVVVGAFDRADARSLVSLYESIDVDANVEVVEPEVAESIKMVNNTFHALKICFANEVGSLAAALGIDGREVMRLVAADRKLNVSDAYLDPGFAFGGACLPKDTKAVATLGADEGLSLPLLGTVPESNETHLGRVATAVDALETDRVGIVGVAFKSETMDTRNSPGLRLARAIDAEPLLYAPDFELSEIVGSNRDYLDRTLPDVHSHLLRDSDPFLDRVDTVVFANDGSYPDLFPGLTSKTVLDPVAAVSDRREDIGDYRPVVW